MEKITMIFVTALSLSFTAQAQQDFLDTTFGDNGIVFQNYMDPITGGVYESEFGTFFLQSDGSIITASNFHHHGPTQKYIINKFNTDGTLHSAFGADGFIDGALENTIGDIHLQSTGKIVGSGRNYNASISYLIRYNSDGSTDSGFGSNGTLSDMVNIIRAFSVQPDDKILVAKASPDYGYQSNFKLMRYNPDGAVDVGFGNNGTVDFSIPQSTIFPAALLMQKDGKIVIKGSIRSDSPGDYSDSILLIRFNTNGSPDTTFGGDGIQVFDYDYSDLSFDILIQTDGKMVFSSSSYGITPGTEPVKRIVRLNAYGTLDSSFGNEGIKIITYPILNIRSLQQASNGKLLAGGIYETSVNPSPTDNPSPTAIVLARYDSKGDLDPTFGQDGYITTTLSNSRALNDKVVIQPDGKILVGASFCESWFSCHPHTVVLRYDPERALTASEFDNNPAFLLYPNPVEETVTMDFTLNQPEELSIDLYGNDGRKILNLLKNQEFQSGFNSLKLDLPGTLAEGIYFLTISNGTSATNIRIVK